jgi:cell division protein FtsQ
MLSENGELFPAPKGEGARLPLFEGPDARATEMIAFHSQARPLFLGSGLQVSQVQLSARGSWSLRLSDGTVVEVGRSDSQHRLERFSRLLPRLQSTDPRKLTRADLRYTNGFALVWADAPAAPTSSMQGIHESQG